MPQKETLGAVTKWRIEWVTGKTFLSIPFCYAHPTLVLNVIRQAHTKFSPECANVFDTACANISSSAAVQFGFLRTVTSVTGVSILKAIF